MRPLWSAAYSGERGNFVQRIFTRYISYVVAAALLAILVLNWGLQGRNARSQMIQNSALKLGQISQTIDNNEVELQNLKESLSEDYLTRAYAFAYIIQQNPSVLESQQEMERIAELLNVDELHVIDENGIPFRRKYLQILWHGLSHYGPRQRISQYSG